MTINVVTPWRDNAELIAAVFGELLPAAGLYTEGDPVFDPTYDKGLWWTRYTPTDFTQRGRVDEPTWDFRVMPYRDDTFAVAAYDPTYQAQGGRETSTIDLSYGRADIPARPADLLGMNIAGLVECLRVTTTVVMVKSMDFITGGELHLHTRHLEDVAGMLGWSVYERLVHQPSGGRPQPGGRAELHARQRHSTLSVLTPYKHRKGIVARRPVSTTTKKAR